MISEFHGRQQDSESVSDISVFYTTRIIKIMKYVLRIIIICTIYCIVGIYCEKKFLQMAQFCSQEIFAISTTRYIEGVWTQKCVLALILLMYSRLQIKRLLINSIWFDC